MIYTVTLNPALDYIMYPNNLSVGEINRSARESLYFGGKGINVSSQIAIATCNNSQKSND